MICGTCCTARLADGDKGREGGRAQRHVLDDRQAIRQAVPALFDRQPQAKGVSDKAAQDMQACWLNRWRVGKEPAQCILSRVVFTPDAAAST